MSQESVSEKKLSTAGFILIGISGGAAITISSICLPFITPALRRICLPYVPATAQQIRNIMSVLAGRSGRFVDLGSGDGRIVLTAAKAGFVADGVELNPWLVVYSRILAYQSGLNSRAKFYRKDLWTYPLQHYRNIIIFGVEEMMPELEAKINKEMCDDAYVVACRFPFPTWKADLILGTGLDTVWLYKNRSSSRTNSLRNS